MSSACFLLGEGNRCTPAFLRSISQKKPLERRPVLLHCDNLWYSFPLCKESQTEVAAVAALRREEENIHEQDPESTVVLG